MPTLTSLRLFADDADRSQDAMWKVDTTFTDTTGSVSVTVNDNARQTQMFSEYTTRLCATLFHADLPGISRLPDVGLVVTGWTYQDDIAHLDITVHAPGIRARDAEWLTMMTFTLCVAQAGSETAALSDALGVGSPALLEAWRRYTESHDVLGETCKQANALLLLTFATHLNVTDAAQYTDSPDIIKLLQATQLQRDILARRRIAVVIGGGTERFPDMAKLLIRMERDTIDSRIESNQRKPDFLDNRRRYKGKKARRQHHR